MIKKLFLCFLLLSTRLFANISSQQVFEVAVSDEFQHLHPFFARFETSKKMLPLVLQSLLVKKSNGSYELALLAEMPQVIRKNSPSLENVEMYSINISPQAKWGDSRLITLEDLRYTLDLAKSFKNELSFCKKLTNIIKSIVINTNNPQQGFMLVHKGSESFLLSLLSELYLINSHIDKQQIDVVGKSKTLATYISQSPYFQKTSR